MAWLGSKALNGGKRTLLTRIFIAAALGWFAEDGGKIPDVEIAFSASFLL